MNCVLQSGQALGSAWIASAGMQENEDVMSIYTLIHRMSREAWCWYEIVSLRQQARHTAKAIDLAGHGQGPTAVDQQSLESYAERVMSMLDTQSTPLIPIGPSHGGMVISRVQPTWLSRSTSVLLPHILIALLCNDHREN